MLPCCTSNPYKNNLCKPCFQKDRYHCTWPNCLRPVLCLTLCRNHYRQINVTCSHTNCHRPSYCKQVCAHHYRKKDFTPIIVCETCTKPVYMQRKCFYHFTSRTCIQCHRTVFSKQKCRRHYMKQWRQERLRSNGPTSINEIIPAAVQAVPETTNQSPDNHSSFKQSDIIS
jgi:hypothetical protein